MKHWRHWLFGGMTIAACCWAHPVAEAADITALTAIDNVGHTRLVMDMDGLPDTYSTAYHGDTHTMTIHLHDTSNKVTSPMERRGQGEGVLKGIRLQPELGGTAIEMQADRSIKHHIITLENPDRMIVDLFTDYDQKLVRHLTDGVALTKWHTSSDKGRVEASVVTVTADTPFQSEAVVPAKSLQQVAAAKPQVVVVRGDGQAMTTPQPVYIGAKAALSAGRQAVTTGALKENDLRPEAELCFTPGSGYSIHSEEPVLHARINGMEYTINGINRERHENELIAYTVDNGPSTGTNQYGFEVAVKNNIVIGAYKQNAPLTPGSIVLSGHGDKAKLLESVLVGMPLVITKQAPIATVGPAGSRWYRGGTAVLENGCIMAKGPDILQARTLLGTVGDGSLLVMAVDRHVNSVGVTAAEGAELLRSLGAVNAMELIGQGAVDIFGDGAYVHEYVANQPIEYQEVLTVG